MARVDGKMGPTRYFGGPYSFDSCLGGPGLAPFLAIIMSMLLKNKNKITTSIDFMPYPF